ncbi:hypothetical protein [Noviherbaspirillum denitrificans]|uniref:Uncharacterized protein n=1 Tax=Noviherbaspirillum denitrificans TaxID=1968433 RepID=A0A254T7R6_9BURK|nr:hypothetical protein [Noviherbaspirillum denitrificans]OWW18694.1 hypothetical protein AYR66_03720 [Noviherbaspirillum denitrificans]
MECNDRSLWRRLALRLQYIWRLAIPFWRFRDAGRGTREQRIANYRHNRSQRNILPFYVWKWVGIAVCMFQILRLFSGLMTTTAIESANYLCVTVFCVSAGIGFAFSCIVIALLTSSYVFLSCVKK